jgi:hypothetical protein
MRGRVPLPLDNLNGTGANRVTATGCGVALTSIGAACTGLETITLGTTNLPPYTPSGLNGSISVTAGGLRFPVTNVGIGNMTPAGGGAQRAPEATTGVWTEAFGMTGSGPTFTGTAQGGVSTPFSRIMPSVGVVYFLRVI